MRVLTIGNRDPRSGAGGYERIWTQVLDALAARGDDTRTLVPPRLPWFWRDGEWIKPGWRERRRIERGALQALEEELAWPPDVVCLWGMGGLPLALIERLRGIPSVGVVGDGWMVYGPEVDPARRAPRLDHVRWLFIAEAVRSRALELHDLPRTDLAHPGVDPAEFPPAPEQPWQWRLACIGRIAPEKGVDVAVQALDALPDEAVLTLDGPGEPPAHPRVRHTHSAPGRIHEAYAAADAILFPVTWEEPWGLVPLEAMAVGRPVIATGTGGSAEYLRDGENCLLVAPGDAAALASAVRRLASDAAHRAALVRGGRETADRFTSERFVDAVLSTLEDEALTARR